MDIHCLSVVHGYYARQYVAVRCKTGQLILPCGVLRPDETFEECALRGLKEQTDFNGFVKRLVWQGMDVHNRYVYCFDVFVQNLSVCKPGTVINLRPLDFVFEKAICQQIFKLV